MTASHSNAPDDFSHLSNDELAAAVATLAAHIHAATWRLLTLIAELDRRGVWADQGALTCAHWLGWACGIDTHTAREKVRVARALEGFPLLSAAAARGELGYSKLRALTRIATVGERGRPRRHRPARHRAARREVRAPVPPGRARAGDRARRCPTQGYRELTYWYEDDGTLVLHGRFPPETGARILSALDAAMEAHAAEQPASQWSSNERKAPDIPGGTSSGVEAEGHVTGVLLCGPEAMGPTSHVGRRRMGESPKTGGRSPEPTEHSSSLRPRWDVFAAAPPLPCAGPTHWRGWPSGCSRKGEAPATQSPIATRVVVHVDAEVLARGTAGRCEIEHHSCPRGGDRTAAVL